MQIKINGNVCAHDAKFSTRAQTWYHGFEFGLVDADDIVRFEHAELGDIHVMHSDNLGCGTKHTERTENTIVRNMFRREFGGSMKDTPFAL